MEQTQRKKLDLELNQPRVLELLFDQPLTGENRYGPYYLYALYDVSSGEEVSFFAPTPDVHEALSSFGTGDRVELLKAARQQGKKVITEYSVRPVNGTAAKLNGNGNGSTQPETPVKSDSLFQILEVCYSDAIKLQERFNGMVDVNRLAITLFIARSKTNGNGIAGAYTS